MTQARKLYQPEVESRGFSDLLAMRNLSSEIGNLIDAEIRRLLDGAQETAMELLTTHEKALREIARVLQQNEVICGETVSRIVAESGEWAAHGMILGVGNAESALLSTSLPEIGFMDLEDECKRP